MRGKCKKHRILGGPPCQNNFDVGHWPGPGEAGGCKLNLGNSQKKIVEISALTLDAPQRNWSGGLSRVLCTHWRGESISLISFGFLWIKHLNFSQMCVSFTGLWSFQGLEVVFEEAVLASEGGGKGKIRGKGRRANLQSKLKKNQCTLL